MTDMVLMLDTPDDQDAQRDDAQQAQISWCVLMFPSSDVDNVPKFRFFALAHELAHNLIKEHNAEHEFWFSAICEAHVVALSQLVANAQGRSRAESDQRGRSRSPSFTSPSRFSFSSPYLITHTAFPFFLAIASSYYFTCSPLLCSSFYVIPVSLSLYILVSMLRLRHA